MKATHLLIISIMMLLSPLLASANMADKEYQECIKSKEQ